MKLDQSNVFRRPIAPWYDSEIPCYMQIIVMLAVALFAITGLSAALAYPEFEEYSWVPALLLFLSGVVFISTLIRLIRRNSVK